MKIEERFPSIPGKPKEQIAIMIISGALDGGNRGEIRDRLGRRIALGYRKFVIDVQGVAPVNMAFVEALLPGVLALRKSERRYCLVSTSPKLTEVLHRTQLEDQFPRFSSQEEAIQSLTTTAQ